MHVGHVHLGPVGEQDLDGVEVVAEHAVVQRRQPDLVALVNVHPVVGVVEDLQQLLNVAVLYDGGEDGVGGEGNLPSVTRHQRWMQ